MLQSPGRSPTKSALPYTTADMSERLAKRKAEQEATRLRDAAYQAISNSAPLKQDKPWYEDLYNLLPTSNPISTPINMGGDAGVSMGGQGTGKSLVTEPARLAVRRAVGDITAIPGLGKSSPSYTADQIRQQGVARGVLGAAIDYSQFIPVVAKGAGVTGDVVNAYKLAMMERQANPFPALRGASNVIDVVPGSRLPSRVVDSPSSPATRLAEARTQRAPYIPQQTGYRTEHTKWWDATKHQAHEVDELGNSFPSLENYPNHEGIWVTHKFDDALKYGDDIREVNLTNATPIHYDGDGGYFYVRPRNAPIATPATRLGNAMAQMTLDARAAQGGVRDAGVLRMPGGEPTPELPAAQLSQPAFRERQVPTSNRLTVETDGPPDPQASQEFVIRAFDNTSDKYKGALTMYWDPIKQKAIVYGMGATDAMVTPQLVSSAAYIIRKYYGDIQFPLEPARNLSAYSRPFVERLQKAGLIDPDFILPEAYELNSINRAMLPDDFADEFSEYSEIIPSLAYQPTYNNVLKALVESKRKAKLEGEYGKLATSSQKLQELKWNPNKLNTAEMYRSNMNQFGFPVHPLFNLFGDEWNNNLLNEIITYPFRGASSLVDAWKKINPAIVENLDSTWGLSFAPTKQNLLKFPQLLQDSNLIDGFTRQRLLVELQDLLE